MARGKEVQLILFKLGDDVYAVELSKVKEVVGLGNIVKVPQSSPAIEGVMNLRGKIVPLIDLATYLGSAKHGGGKVLVYSFSDGKEIGFVVDYVVGVLRISCDEIKNTNLGRVSPIVIGFIDHEGKLIPVLDLEGIAQNVVTLLGGST